MEYVGGGGFNHPLVKPWYTQYVGGESSPLNHGKWNTWRGGGDQAISWLNHGQWNTLVCKHISLVVSIVYISPLLSL